MQITPQYLKEQGFEFLEKVKHYEYNSFLQKLNWNYSKTYWFYNFCLVLSVTLTLILIAVSYEAYLFKFLYAFLGVLLAMILIIVHECIHYLMYMIFGAEKIRIARYEGKEYILTQADHFLVGKKEIGWIALMPYVIITLSCLLLIPFSESLIQILLSSTILMHTTMSKEDFRIIHYFSSQKSDVKMYTDINSETTFFYKRKVEGSKNKY